MAQEAKCEVWRVCEACRKELRAIAYVSAPTSQEVAAFGEPAPDCARHPEHLAKF